ncbi:hypothetical protein ABW21_db0208589 [Orbilia brochopaga]|nr:hypothetical protein ABW21_db0208589 [Drechslerella brochopaga]
MTLRGLALHDMVGQEMLWTEIPIQHGPGPSDGWTLNLDELSVACDAAIDERGGISFGNIVLTPGTQEALETLYLVPWKALAVGRESEIVLSNSFELRIRIEALIGRAYRNATSKPKLKYVVFGTNYDWIFRVNWVLNANTWLPDEQLWIAALCGCEWSEDDAVFPPFIGTFLMGCPNLRSLTFPLTRNAFPNLELQESGKFQFPSLQELLIVELLPLLENMLLVASLIKGAPNLKHLSVHTNEATSELLTRDPNPPLHDDAEPVGDRIAHLHLLHPKLGPDLKTLVAETLYIPLAHIKALRSLSIEGLPLHLSLGDYLSTCQTLENLTIRKVTEAQEVAEIFQNHEFKLRRLHVLASHAQLPVFRPLVQNLLPGLETLIFLTNDKQDRAGSEDTDEDESGSELTDDTYDGVRHLFDEATLNRHSASLKRLALHVIIDGSLRISSRPGSGDSSYPEWSGLQLTELSTVCIILFESGHCARVFAPAELLPRSTLRILYLAPDDINLHGQTGADIAKDPDRRLSLQFAIHKWVRETYRGFQQRPPLRYIIFGLQSDLLFVVNWIPNGNNLLSPERWLSFVEPYDLAMSYGKLRGETFELYDVSFMVNTGQDRLPPFRYYK